MIAIHGHKSPSNLHGFLLGEELWEVKIENRNSKKESEEMSALKDERRVHSVTH